MLRGVAVPTNVVLTTPSKPRTNTESRASWKWHAADKHNRWRFGADTDHALLLVGAFRAIFSERLVPDLFNRIAKKTEGAA